VHARGQLLHHLDPLEALTSDLTRNDSVEDSGDEPSLNSGMYS
jgi:hypothetical protein